MISTVVYDTLAPESIVAVALVGLIILIVARDLSTAGDSSFGQRLGQNIGVYTFPLLLVFLFVVVTTVIDAAI